MISITSAPEAPPPRIRILDTKSREVETVRIGDKLTFRIEIPEESKFQSWIPSFWLIRKGTIQNSWKFDPISLVQTLDFAGSAKSLWTEN